MITLKNWHGALAHAQLDPVVGIKIAPLTHDIDFAMHITEMKSGAKVSAHYHQQGVEIYQILAGSGRIYTALVENEQILNTACYLDVTAGDFFEIPACMAHQLVNTGDVPLILVFACPNTHLGTDRVIVSDLMEVYSHEKADKDSRSQAESFI